jgi:glyoxylase-like metal-dependent hydrolase (beta-lactamase superfamily II)
VMPLRIHHLDCASMCPLARRWVNGTGGLFERGAMPAHCLLVETPASGLVLVDAGFGTADLAAPRERLGPTFTRLLHLAPSTTPALAHVRALGFDPKDVRHVVVTHLDLDHAGGITDFPWAKVHVHAAEQGAALAPSLVERDRYRPCHFAHGPDWSLYEATGEPWKGFPAVRSLPGLPPEILAIPLSGHTRGHACVAVDRGDRWLLHAGDAYFHRSRIAGGPTPPALRLFEWVVARDHRRVLDNHRRLGELARDPGVEIFSSHDPDELARLSGAGRPQGGGGSGGQAAAGAS